MTLERWKRPHDLELCIFGRQSQLNERAKDGLRPEPESMFAGDSLSRGDEMELIILIPAIACWVVLARDSARSALINVYLPSVLLLPQSFELRFPHLPPLTFADAAILPLGVAVTLTEIRRWRWDWMDLLIVMMAISAGLSEGLSTVLADGTWVRIFTSPAETLQVNVGNGTYQLAGGITMIVLPYMVGKSLIEKGEYKGQPVRNAILQRMVILLACIAVISVIDFLTGKGIWILAFRHFFPGQNWWAWPTQMRWGFGRITGPFAHAILAGMVFLMGLTYCIWLRAFSPRWGTRKIMKGLPFTARGFVLWALVAGLLMTQSRGPWLGAILALLFVYLMLKFPVAKATVIFLVLLAVFSVAGYYYGNKYTEVAQSQATQEAQASAIYRRDLIRNYMPAVKARKLFGWGITTYPAMAGQQSIDNQYLMLAVTQGLLGLGLFVVILAASGGRLLWLAAQPMQAEDRGLVFAHLAVLIGLMTALATVYLGEQTQLLLFLLVGWVQGMSPVRVTAGAQGPVSPRLEFRRVLT
jgi:O-antigen ligase